MRGNSSGERWPRASASRGARFPVRARAEPPAAGTARVPCPPARAAAYFHRVQVVGLWVEDLDDRSGDRAEDPALPAAGAALPVAGRGRRRFVALRWICVRPYRHRRSRCCCQCRCCDEQVVVVPEACVLRWPRGCPRPPRRPSHCQRHSRVRSWWSRAQQQRQRQQQAADCVGWGEAPHHCRRSRRRRAARPGSATAQPVPLEQTRPVSHRRTYQPAVW